MEQADALEETSEWMEFRADAMGYCLDFLEELMEGGRLEQKEAIRCLLKQQCPNTSLSTAW